MRKTEFWGLLSSTEQQQLAYRVINDGDGSDAVVWTAAIHINDSIDHDSFAGICNIMWNNGIISSPRLDILMTYQPASNAQIDVPLLTDQE